VANILLIYKIVGYRFTIILVLQPGAITKIRTSIKSVPGFVTYNKLELKEILSEEGT
jgi:hypothetical protein